MTSIKIKFRASTVAGKEGCLYYQIIHNRVIRQISTEYKLLASEWDNRSGIIVLYPYNSDTERAALVCAIQERVRWDKVRLNKIVESLDSQGIRYTTDDVVSLFYEQAQVQSFFNFMQSVIVQLKKLGKVRTSETYAAALKSFMCFREEKDIMLDEMDSDLMMLYEAWLKERSVSMNTISFYMRILRATYNRAVEKELTRQRYPFKNVYTGVEKTVKRAIPFNIIKRIKGLDLSWKPSLELARDIFLFSFYTRGMSFVDMAYLKKRDLKNGILVYRRRKTGQQLFVKWEKCMQEIIDKYPDTGTIYLLPIIRQPGNERKQYENALHLVNHRLKEISSMLNLPIHLTMYVARHSWASIARSKNIPISVISEGMGHDSENTTQIYLASLDHSVIDKANKLILKNL
ncbi:site-specific integrase [uncultured Bacteroides sp.]|jgi:Site-specific recombinase XerD|uniref:site-specific integrase n=1 Tax=uncultured Bacteroides sp. TaxID=162156 RepID=UPI0026758922|nr:site-specific integrase [uncultured Bacteroides sp.]